MQIKSATFLKSSSGISQCPAPAKPEYAFIGRSNVGKSSLINMLLNHKGLAKTSSTPGKTQLINHYEINSSWYIVDLPGYGYAKLSQTAIAEMEKMISNYLLKRENLMCVFVLIDSRIDPQKSDLSFLTQLGQNHVPVVIAFTKVDKQSQSKTQTNIAMFKKALLKEWEFLPEMFISSSETKTGREEILKFIGETNIRFADHQDLNK